jgi:tetratricopeptide (TPR) repeat protein
LRAGLLKGFVAVSGVILAVIVTYQAAIFGLSFRAGKIRDPEQRVSYLARLSRLPSGYANLYFQLAIDCKNLFETQKNSRYGSDAVHYFQSAADLNPENAQYFYQWAEFLYRSGLDMNNEKLLDEAEKVGKESLVRSDKLPFPYLMLANIAHLKKDFAQEEKWLKMALDLEPYFFLGRLSLVDLYIEEGKLGEAKSQFGILQGQKQEVDQILKKETVEVRTLNDSQLLLVRISPEDMQRVQKELETR